jgi:hypothetical protein
MVLYDFILRIFQAAELVLVEPNEIIALLIRDSWCCQFFRVSKLYSFWASCWRLYSFYSSSFFREVGQALQVLVYFLVVSNNSLLLLGFDLFLMCCGFELGNFRFFFSFRGICSASLALITPALRSKFAFSLGFFFLKQYALLLLQPGKCKSRSCCSSNSIPA